MFSAALFPGQAMAEVLQNIFDPSDGTDASIGREAKTEEDIAIAMAGLRSKIARLRGRQRTAWVVAVVIALASILVLFVAPWIASRFETSPKNVAAVALVTAAYGIIIFGAGAFVMSGRRGRLETQLDVYQERLRIFQRLSGAQPKDEQGQTKSSYFEQLVGINVENLADYYGLVKNHTDNSFRSTVAVAVLGFILISTGLIAGFFASEERRIITYMSAGAGIITEFIAAVFFYLYNRTVRQLREYHDSLIAVQNILLSFKLIGDYKDADRQPEMIEKIVTFLLAAPPGEAAMRVTARRASKKPRLKGKEEE